MQAENAPQTEKVQEVAELLTPFQTPYFLGQLDF
jgi:hypothetical protein